MGNINITGTAKEKLEVLAKDDDRTPSGMAQRLINEEFRNRKGLKVGVKDNDN